MRMFAYAAALLLPAVSAGPALADETVWDHFAPGYYVETDEAGGVDCSRPEGTNWVYLHPERREDATIPGVFSTYMGWMAFSLNSNEEDFFLDGLRGSSLDLNENQREMLRNYFDSHSQLTAHGVGLSGGGLGYTTGGNAVVNIGVHIDTGNIRIYRAYFEEYGRRRDIVTSGEGRAAHGFLLDGRELRAFVHCNM